MKRKSIMSLLILAGVSLLWGVFSPLLAEEAPGIIIELKLDDQKGIYGTRDFIPATVTVSNAYKKKILISNGFKDSEFYMEMLVIDPAGKVVHAKRQGEHVEYPDAPQSHGG